MSKHYKWLLLALIILFSVEIFAQRGIKDSSIFIPSISINYAYQLPVGGNIEYSYGGANAVGGDIMFKLKNSFMLGMGFEYFFSDNINNGEQYFKNIKNSNGYVIDGNGQFAEAYLYFRGYNIQLLTGYQFGFWSPNPNSGPFVQLGIGFMEYKTKIENPGRTANQLIDDYNKMYDRLRNGFSTTQVLGYKLMSKRNLTNFFIGVEFTQAWTDNRRSYNADLDASEMGKKIDLQIGIKVGWVIPFYGRAPKDFYYF